MNRRQVLAGSASLALAGAAPVASGALAAPEPLLELGARWEAARAAVADAVALVGAATDDPGEVLWSAMADRSSELNDIAEEIVETPATTLAGMLVKLRATAWYTRDGLVADGYQELDERGILSIAEDAERLFGKGGAT